MRLSSTIVALVLLYTSNVCGQLQTFCEPNHLCNTCIGTEPTDCVTCRDGFVLRPQDPLFWENPTQEPFTDSFVKGSCAACEDKPAAGNRDCSNNNFILGCYLDPVKNASEYWTARDHCPLTCGFCKRTCLDDEILANEKYNAECDTLAQSIPDFCRVGSTFTDAADICTQSCGYCSDACEDDESLLSLFQPGVNNTCAILNATGCCDPTSDCFAAASQSCKSTCGLCPKLPCEDDTNYMLHHFGGNTCEQLAAGNQCNAPKSPSTEFLLNLLKSRCPLTCGYCVGNDTVAVCQDDSFYTVSKYGQNCVQLADSGFCHSLYGNSSKAFHEDVLDHCPDSCGVCNGTAPPLPPSIIIDDGCVNDDQYMLSVFRHSCNYFASGGHCNITDRSAHNGSLFFNEVLAARCPRACGFCTPNECADEDIYAELVFGQNCSTLASLKLCDEIFGRVAAVVVNARCPSSCGLCPVDTPTLVPQTIIVTKEVERKVAASTTGLVLGIVFVTVILSALCGYLYWAYKHKKPEVIIKYETLLQPLDESVGPTRSDQSFMIANPVSRRFNAIDEETSDDAMETPIDKYLAGRQKGKVFENEIDSSAEDSAYYETPVFNPNYGYSSVDKQGGSTSTYAEPQPNVVGKRQSIYEYVAIGMYLAPGFEEEDLYDQLNLLAKNVSRDNLMLGEKLGSGQFADVVKGALVTDGKEKAVAAKILKRSKEPNDRVKFLQEACIMAQFDHPHVLPCSGIVSRGDPLVLLSPIMLGGSLDKWLLEQHEINHGLFLRMAGEAASALEYLAARGFVHRDIAARNCLLTKDLHLSIGDFGLARDTINDDYYRAHGGKVPVRWTAPEALFYKKFTTASDVWSFGILLYEIFSLGDRPYGRWKNAKVLAEVDLGYRLPPPPNCMVEVYEIMIKCWNKDPRERPTFTKVHEMLAPLILQSAMVDRSGSVSSKASDYIRLQRVYLEPNVHTHVEYANASSGLDSGIKTFNARTSSMHSYANAPGSMDEEQESFYEPLTLLEDVEQDVEDDERFADVPEITPVGTAAYQNVEVPGINPAAEYQTFQNLMTSQGGDAYPIAMSENTYALAQEVLPAPATYTQVGQGQRRRLVSVSGHGESETDK